MSQVAVAAEPAEKTEDLRVVHWVCGEFAVYTEPLPIAAAGNLLARLDSCDVAGTLLHQADVPRVHALFARAKVPLDRDLLIVPNVGSVAVVWEPLDVLRPEPEDRGQETGDRGQAATNLSQEKQEPAGGPEPSDTRRKTLLGWTLCIVGQALYSVEEVAARLILGTSHKRETH